MALPLTTFETDVPIDATGVAAKLYLRTSDDLAVHIRGGETADYALDVSPDGETWFEGVTTYSGTDVDAVEVSPDAWVRVRVTTAAATAGTTADIYLAASPN